MATRRDKGTGSVYYLASRKKWQAKLYVNGKPITKTAATEKEAKKQLREMIKTQKDLADAKSGKSNSQTFEDYATHWLNTVQKNVLAKSSYRNLSYDLNHYVFPEIGLCQMSKLSKDDIQGLIQKLLAQKKSLSTIKRIKSSISGCLNYAVRENDIPYNICQSVVMPTKKAHPELKKKPICVLTSEEIDRYVARATEKWKNGTPIYRIGWGLVFILATGIRREEAAAIEWADINYDTKLAHICKAASFVEDESGEHKTVQVILDLTKSDCSERFVPLSDDAIFALKQLEEITGDYKYVLGVSKAKPIDMNTLGAMNSRVMTAAKIKRPAGVKKGLHALRHTFCSHLIMADPPMDIKTISEIMGHADTGITMNVYGHIFDERKQKAVSTTNFLPDALRKK